MSHSVRFALSKTPLRCLLAGSMLVVLFAVLASAATAGHIRPKGASPLRVTLVHAYNPCTAPNRTHGPPLAFPSCNPPVPVSPLLTSGNPNAGLEGAVKFKSIVGIPANGIDDADVQVKVDITDVRCTGGGGCTGPANSPGPQDYAGELQVRVTLRSTDHYNDLTGSSTGTDPATSADTYPSTDPVDLRIPVLCGSPATGTAIGAECHQLTTIDALYPSTPVSPATAVKEAVRSNWELGQVKVHDGGADGVASTSPNNVFLVQGIFIP